MSPKTKRILVVGATGQIGSELTPSLRNKYGHDRVIATWHQRKPDKILKSGQVEKLDATNAKNFAKIIDKYDIDTVYHLAALISAVGEKNPSLAWRVNMNGLRNLLEISKERDIAQIFWPSSIGVFGQGTPRVNTPNDAVMLPTTMYGVTKVAGELLCNYYFKRFGLDVRCVRYPGIISSETLPGGGTTDYNVEMFYEAIEKKRYSCFVSEETVLPMLYMPDCIKAAIDVMEADKSRIKWRFGYNVTGMSPSVGELASEIKKYIPDFRCEYKPDFRQKIADSWPKSLDDSVAKKEWGWSPTYDLASVTSDMISKLQKKLRNHV